MTTFIIATLTADGCIAKNIQHSSITWRSKDDRKFFIERTKKAGLAVIMGLTTAKTAKNPLPGRLNIIYANNREEVVHWVGFEGWEVTQKDPKALLADLAQKGYSEVAICGGSTIYTMFMEAGAVDKLYLTVESVIFGSGIRLFNKELDAHLQLVSVQKIGENTFLAEYDVVKKYEIAS